jgi:hypothetical protein
VASARRCCRFDPIAPPCRPDRATNRAIIATTIAGDGSLRDRSFIPTPPVVDSSLASSTGYVPSHDPCPRLAKLPNMALSARASFRHRRGTRELRHTPPSSRSPRWQCEPTIGDNRVAACSARGSNPSPIKAVIQNQRWPAPMLAYAPVAPLLVEPGSMASASADPPAERIGRHCNAELQGFPAFGTCHASWAWAITALLGNTAQSTRCAARSDCESRGGSVWDRGQAGADALHM